MSSPFHGSIVSLGGLISTGDVMLPMYETHFFYETGSNHHWFAYLNSQFLPNHTTTSPILLEPKKRSVHPCLALSVTPTPSPPAFDGSWGRPEGPRAPPVAERLPTALLSEVTRELTAMSKRCGRVLGRNNFWPPEFAMVFELRPNFGVQVKMNSRNLDGTKLRSIKINGWVEFDD